MDHRDIIVKQNQDHRDIIAECQSLTTSICLCPALITMITDYLRPLLWSYPADPLLFSPRQIITVDFKDWICPEIDLRNWCQYQGFSAATNPWNKLPPRAATAEEIISGRISILVHFFSGCNHYYEVIFTGTAEEERQFLDVFRNT